MSGQCGNNYNIHYCEDITHEEMREIMDKHVPANYWRCDSCGNMWSDNLVVCIKCNDSTDSHERL